MRYRRPVQNPETFSFRLDLKTKRTLYRVAKVDGVGPADIVRRAIKTELEQHVTTPTPTTPAAESQK